jgi:hypothetical protein
MQSTAQKDFSGSRRMEDFSFRSTSAIIALIDHTSAIDPSFSGQLFHHSFFRCLEQTAVIAVSFTFELGKSDFGTSHQTAPEHLALTRGEECRKQILEVCLSIQVPVGWSPPVPA